MQTQRMEETDAGIASAKRRPFADHDCLCSHRTPLPRHAHVALSRPVAILVPEKPLSRPDLSGHGLVPWEMGDVTQTATQLARSLASSGPDIRNLHVDICSGRTPLCLRLGSMSLRHGGALQQGSETCKGLHYNGETE